jgi:neutral trehalase
MEVYEFASERQYVFKVETDGIPKLVAFGDTYGNNASMFQTRDRKVAEAIRRTSMFRRGAIKETTKPEETAVAAAKQPIERGGEQEGNKGSKEAQKATKPKMEEKIFTNITQAKDWVSKEYKIPKTQLKKPESVVAEAKKHKVKLIIKAIEA